MINTTDIITIIALNAGAIAIIHAWTKAGDRQRAYISGSITNGGTTDPGDAFERFQAVEQQLQDLGFDTVNPMKLFSKREQQRLATMDQREAWKIYMRRDLKHLLGCQVVVALPGWQASEGAVLEITTARHVGLPVLCAVTMKPIFV